MSISGKISYNDILVLIVMLVYLVVPFNLINYKISGV